MLSRTIPLTLSNSSIVQSAHLVLLHLVQSRFPVVLVVGLSAFFLVTLERCVGLLVACEHVAYCASELRICACHERAKEYAHPLRRHREYVV